MIEEGMVTRERVHVIAYRHNTAKQDA